MRGLAAFLLGFMLFTVGYLAGNDNNRQFQAASQQLENSATYLRNIGRTDGDQRNSYLLGLVANNAIAFDDYERARAQDVGDKIMFLPFMEGIDWGQITVRGYMQTTGGDDVPCVRWKGENEYDCATDDDERVKCGIYVDIEKGPLKGTYLLTRPCDGVPISRRVHVDIPGTPGMDGYEVKYQDITIIR